MHTYISHGTYPSFTLVVSNIFDCISLLFFKMFENILLLWVELCTSGRYVEVLTPNSYKVIWK